MNSVQGRTVRREVDLGFSKTANILTSAKNKIKQFLIDKGSNPYVSQIGIPAGVSLLAYGAAKLIDNIDFSLKDRKVQKNISNLTQNLSQEPEFQNKTPMLQKRMREMSMLSPSVAQTPLAAKPFLKETIDKNELDLSDIETLLGVESKLMSTRVKHQSGDLAKLFRQGTVTKLVAPVLAHTIALNNKNFESTMKMEARRETPAKAPEPKKFLGIKMPTVGQKQEKYTYEHYMKDFVKPLLNTYKEKHGELPKELQGFDINKRSGLMGAYHTITQNKELDRKLAPYKKEMMMKKEGVSLNQYLNKAPEKASSFWSKLDPSIKKGLFGALAAVGIGSGFGATQEVAKFVKSKKENKKIEESWGNIRERLLKLKPHEGETSRNPEESYKNPKVMDKARGFFNSIASFAPSIAKDPVLGTTIINNIMDLQGNIDVSTLKNLVDIQKGVSMSQEYRSPFAQSPFVRGLATGFGVAGGEDFISQLPRTTMKG